MPYPSLITMFCAYLLAAAIPGAAEQYPSRPIRMILPQASGSTTDTVGRIVFTATAERLNQQIVVDNRAGAGGTIGMEMASRAAPDGYTLVGVAASMMAITPHIYSKLSYHPLKDFAPVGMFVLSETALCVNDKLPVKSIREFVELAKARPGQLAVGSAGVGSTSHLVALLFTTLAGVTTHHVPYKGGANMMAVAQGEVQWVLVPLSAAMVQVNAGRIRCLASGGDKRSAITSHLPTIAESGVPGFRFYGWNGVVAPRGTPRTVIITFNRVMNEALDSPEVRKRYLVLGSEPAIGTPEDFGKLIREDYEQMGKLVKQAGIRPE